MVTSVYVLLAIKQNISHPYVPFLFRRNFLCYLFALFLACTCISIHRYLRCAQIWNSE